MASFSIEGFEILEKLGQGGLGAVYKARQISLDRLVAIKTLPVQTAGDPTTVEQFQLEAKIAAALRHPNIVQIYEAGVHEGLYYFVMEYISGYTVGSWVQRKGKLAEKDALLVIEFVATALEYAWNKARIIHGDVKPDNIMVDEDGTIKVADFLAFLRPGGTPGPTSLSGTAVGTPNFMSPEQVVSGSKLDYRADMYSLGAVLYQLTTGKYPFSDITDGRKVMNRQIKGYIPDPGELNPEISEGVAWLMEKLMVKDRDFRYVSWDQVLTDINRVRAGKIPLYPLPAVGASTVKRAKSRIPPPATQGARPVRKPLPDSVGPPSWQDPPDEAIGPVEKWLYLLVLLAVVAGISWMLYLRPWGDTKEEVVETVVVHPEQVEPELEESEFAEVQEQLLEEEPVRAEDPFLSRSELEIEPAPVVEEPALDEMEPEFAEDVIEDKEEDITVAEEPLPAEEKLSQQEARAGLLEYLALMEKVISRIEQRAYEQVRAILAGWIDEHSGHEYVQQAEKNMERLNLLTDQLRTLAENKKAVLGLGVRIKPRLSGKIIDIEDDKVTILRRTRTGEVEFPISVYRIHERDFTDLLKRADPERYMLNMAVIHTAKGHFDKASNLLKRAEVAPDEILIIQQWIDDWRHTLMNIRANKAVDELIALVEAFEFEQADAKLRDVKPRHGMSDIFSWARKPEIDQVTMAIENGLSSSEAISAPEKEQPEPGKLEEPFWQKKTDKKALQAAMPAKERTVEQITVSDLKQKFMTFDGQLVKLSFHARGDIRQVSEEAYTTDLGHEGVYVHVEFPQEGFQWINNIPRWVGKRRKTVYGVVDAKSQKVDLIGRTKTTPLGRQALEYSW